MNWRHSCVAEQAGWSTRATARLARTRGGRTTNSALSDHGWGHGFLGSHLTDRLLDAGHEVVVFDNLITGAEDNLAHRFGHRFRFVKQDVTEFIYLPGDLDAVVHLASPASPIDYLRMPIPTLKVGSLGTHKALGLCMAKNARFLLASTSEVYGDPQVHPQPETYWGHVNPVGPRGVYDEAKRFAEAITMAYQRYHGWTPASSGSSTPTGRGCASTTAGSSRTSSSRR